MKAYADFPSVVADQSAAPNHTVKRELVIAFLQSLHDRKIQAWRRWQAARAIEAYQGTVLQSSEVDFRPIRETLQETTMIHTHVMNRPGLAVTSRLAERIGRVAAGRSGGTAEDSGSTLVPAACRTHCPQLSSAEPPG
ncbi:hypothetical protein [Stieleria mannarensis]|uniref:hypothetical protein n=1 Tax=Stieleria mannarensis TaxID=2755585 RepID=UPI0016021916|nr:hypothetical protein [Rhodopirellula sp. JC639]